MFFEGSEKKAEIFIEESYLSLLDDIDDAVWHDVVSAGNAQILSSMVNPHCKAFILSESSLFIWHDHFLILTCGVTQLIKSIEFFIKYIGKEKIIACTYQRKNEYYAHAQLSTFSDDITILTQYITGNALRFGEIEDHHNYFFYKNANKITNRDKTYEFIAYQVNSDVLYKLSSNVLKFSDIRDFLQLDILFPKFILDDFIFKPHGYSVNGLYNDKYFTIHITPQLNSSYISFAANIDLIPLMPLILTILQPASFDLLSINDRHFEQDIQQQIPKNYVSKTFVKHTLNNSNIMYFANYILPQKIFCSASPFNLIEDNHAL
ncbi:MAG: S-adenosylmethionine decarboxylase [Alteromonadaceae bacterium]